MQKALTQMNIQLANIVRSAHTALPDVRRGPHPHRRHRCDHRAGGGLKAWRKKKPELFNKRVYKQAELDSTGLYGKERKGFVERANLLNRPLRTRTVGGVGGDG
ncbi:MAG: hypothetical protein Q8K34_17350 [Hydrogenophaga sp.]|nr:hypothetical protein [Hydrogenophaga sp.]MDP3922121.1 hypothetical protein [Hydrogenophaga sp.]